MWLPFSRELVSKHCDCKGQACMVPTIVLQSLALFEVHSMLMLVRFLINQSIKRSHKFSKLPHASTYMAPCAFN